MEDDCLGTRYATRGSQAQLGSVRQRQNWSYDLSCLVVFHAGSKQRARLLFVIHINYFCSRVSHPGMQSLEGRQDATLVAGTFAQRLIRVELNTEMLCMSYEMTCAIEGALTSTSVGEASNKHDLTANPLNWCWVVSPSCHRSSTDCFY